MWDIAPEFSAAVVFAEHRFYGKTQPFGNNSYAKVSNLGYLSSEQALADFVELINYLKNEVLLKFFKGVFFTA
jgi:lysosomal Pro-X carboxypeptidase